MVRKLVSYQPNAKEGDYIYQRSSDPRIGSTMNEYGILPDQMLTVFPIKAWEALHRIPEEYRINDEMRRAYLTLESLIRG